MNRYGKDKMDKEKSVKFGVLFVLLCSASMYLRADVFSTQHQISQKQLTNELKKQFPFDKTYKDVTVTFSAPKARIDALDKTVEIDVTLTSEKDGRGLVLSAELQGELEYHNVDETIRIERPLLDRIQIKQDDMADSAPIVKIIKQSMARDMPDLTLFRVENLNSDGPVSSSIEIEIFIDKLVLKW